MSTIKWYGAFTLAISCVVAAVLFGTSGDFSAGADDTQTTGPAPGSSPEAAASRPSAWVARIANTLASLNTSLIDATRVAETAAHGRAFDVQLEREGGRWCYEVATCVAGQPPRIVEVSVDATTGVISEIEAEDDEDDDDED